MNAAEVAESERRLRLLLQHAYDAVVVVDPAGAVTYVSASTRHVLGYEPEDLLGRSAFEVIHPDDLAPAQAKLGEVLARPEANVHTELRVRHKDGSWGWFEITGTNLLHEPTVRGIVSNFRDVTERRQALDRERALREEAEQARAALQLLLNEKEVLLREVHHRVKNNMQVIAGLLDLHHVEIDDPRALRLLQEAKTRIHVMAQVHQRLYAREGLETIDLGAFFQELVPELVGLYMVPGQEISLEADYGHVDVGLDAALACGLLVHELVSSALAHAFPDSRSGTIAVALSGAGPGGQVRLRVGHDGVGLPEDFDIRGSRTFGMKLVHSLIRQIDASLAVERERGTAFTITFGGNSLAQARPAPGPQDPYQHPAQ